MAKKKTQDRMVIIDGVRTPFCKMGSDFAALGADELGRVAVQGLLARTGIDPEIIDEVIMGCVGQPVDAANVSRVIALRAGIPRSVPAITVHRNCASGCEAITQARQKMAAGDGEVFVVGGAESMSQYPLVYKFSTAAKFALLNRARTPARKLKAMTAFRPADFEPRIGLKLGLSDPVCGLNMGETAELIGREAGITRLMQDEFSVTSHQRAVAARERLAEEITPLYVPPRYKKVVTEDNGPRADQSVEILATKLKPVFDRTSGTVTAGNASQITDGAVALLVMSESKARELKLKPIGVLSAYSYAACDPSRMGLGPLYAIARAEKQSGLKLADADLIEINEAFAAQVLAVMHNATSKEFAQRELGRDKALGEIPSAKLNVNGGAIALGHPVGSTGARLVLTLLKELRRRKKKRGLASLCVGGGQGAALWVEALA
ncbi:MAG: thiolase family protein [Verrucomicrobiota bacterium]